MFGVSDHDLMFNREAVDDEGDDDVGMPNHPNDPNYIANRVTINTDAVLYRCGTQPKSCNTAQQLLFALSARTSQIFCMDPM